MQIHQTETEGVDILELTGSLVLGEEDAALRECLRLLTAAGKVRIALNLKALTRIDSTGLGTLVAAARSLQSAGGRLTLFNLNPPQVDLMLLTKLYLVFEMFTDERDAVNSYFPGRSTAGYDVLAFVRQQEQVETGTGAAPAVLAV